MRKLTFLMALSLAIPMPALANDTAFGGSGATPMPIKQDKVAMENEHIVIQGHDINREDMKGKWEYNCDYTFKNTSDLSLSFQMGFPFPVNNEESDITTPSGYSSDRGSALVHDFTVTLDGKVIPSTKSKISPLPEQGLNYEDAYIWHMTIAPHQTIKLHHHYLTGVTINSMGQNTVSFVLKTGALWQGGNIGLSQLEVIPNTPTRMCIEVDKNADYAKPTPAGVKAVDSGKDRKYIWELKHFTPKEDLDLCLVTGKNYVHYYIVYPLLQNNLDISKSSPSELQILRNTIYAQYGRRFENAKLQAYFDKQWWYEPNPNYSDTLLSEDDKTAINQIKKQEG